MVAQEIREIGQSREQLRTKLFLRPLQMGVRRLLPSLLTLPGFAPDLGKSREELPAGQACPLTSVEPDAVALTAAVEVEAQTWDRSTAQKPMAMRAEASNSVRPGRIGPTSARGTGLFPSRAELLQHLSLEPEPVVPIPVKAATRSDETGHP